MNREIVNINYDLRKLQFRHSNQQIQERNDVMQNKTHGTSK